MREPARILVVDDVPDNVEILQMRLESQGYEVVTAGDGVEALEKVRELRPDLVLLDIMMPRMDGIETVKQIKADTSLPFIPVILVTARADAKDVIAGLESGGDDYLTKPVDHAALSARVRAMLRIKALHDTVQAQATAAGGAGSGARRVEPDFGGTGRSAGRRNRAGRQAEAVSGAADRGNHRLVWRRDDPRSSPARYRRAVLRHARLYRLCRNRRAGGRDGCARRISRRAGAADPSLRGHPRSLCRGRSDRLFQRPGAMSRSGAPCGAARGRDARSGHRARPLLGGPRARNRLWRRHRPRLRHPRPDRVRGPLRLQRHRHCDQPRGETVRRGAGWARFW